MQFSRPNTDGEVDLCQRLLDGAAKLSSFEIERFRGMFNRKYPQAVLEAGKEAYERATPEQRSELKGIQQAMDVGPGNGSLLPYDPKMEKMPGKLDCPEFQAKWIDWCNYREKSKKSPLSEAEAQSQLTSLKYRSSVEVAIAMLVQSMDKGQIELVSKAAAKKAANTLPDPTLEEVVKFVEDEGIKNVDPVTFFNKYDAVGWRTASNVRILNWKAKLLDWTKNDFNNSSVGSKAKGKNDWSDPDYSKGGEMRKKKKAETSAT